MLSKEITKLLPSKRSIIVSPFMWPFGGTLFSLILFLDSRFIPSFAITFSLLAACPFHSQVLHKVTLLMMMMMMLAATVHMQAA